MSGEAQSEFSRLAEMIQASERAVVFTGRGFSTDSGIPNFRGPGGLRTKFQPIKFEDFIASEETRREAWRRKFAMDEAMKPPALNRGHRAVSALVERGKVTAVITQNVDGLHQASGVPDNQVIELHGNSTYARCLDCLERHELVAIKEAFLADETLPICAACGGIVKMAVISFGQPMPEVQMAQAQQATLAADLFLAIGSSLDVHPSADFPVVAKRNGAKLAILNREPTKLDEIADLVVNAEISDALGNIVGNS